MNNKELKKKLIKKFGKWFYYNHFKNYVYDNYDDALEDCFNITTEDDDEKGFPYRKHSNALWNRIYSETAKHHLEHFELREVTTITITKLEEDND